MRNNRSILHKWIWVYIHICTGRHNTHTYWNGYRKLLHMKYTDDGLFAQQWRPTWYALGTRSRIVNSAKCPWVIAIIHNGNTWTMSTTVTPAHMKYMCVYNWWIHTPYLCWWPREASVCVMHACMYNMFVCRYVCIHVCIHVYLVCMYVCNVCTYIRMYGCMYVCVGR